MKLIDTKCPHCGAKLKIDDKKAVCEFCGSSLLVDDEVKHIQYDNAEDLGYNFEKGRQRAQAELKASKKRKISHKKGTKKTIDKKKTILWILGWIFIFPVPVILILRNNKKLSNAFKTVTIIASCLLYLFVAFACVRVHQYNVMTGIETESSGKEDSDKIVSDEHTQVKFTMENGGSFIIELYPEYAPETVENFINLVSEGFYDGLTFHRVIENFMAQGGDPEGTGSGGSDKKITGEFSANGFKDNKLSHTRGVVSMARRPDSYDSASSQFFICFVDSTYLDGDYAAFGKVIEGMEVVDAFLDVERTMDSSGYKSVPVTPIVIEKAEVI